VRAGKESDDGYHQNKRFFLLKPRRKRMKRNEILEEE
jgi:hypothetical protein